MYVAPAISELIESTCGATALGIASCLAPLLLVRLACPSAIAFLARRDKSDSWRPLYPVPVSLLGYFPDGSENPVSLLLLFLGFAGKVPRITGICPSSPSLKKPRTVAPCINAVVSPMPEIPAEVVGITGTAHGKSTVGSSFLSSVWYPSILTRHLPSMAGSARSSTTPIHQLKIGYILIFSTHINTFWRIRESVLNHFNCHNMSVCIEFVMYSRYYVKS